MAERIQGVGVAFARFLIGESNCESPQRPAACDWAWLSDHSAMCHTCGTGYTARDLHWMKRYFIEREKVAALKAALVSIASISDAIDMQPPGADVP